MSLDAFLEHVDSEDAKTGRKCLTCRLFAAQGDEVRAKVEAVYLSADNRSSVWRSFSKAFSPDFSSAAFHNHFRLGHHE